MISSGRTCDKCSATAKFTVKVLQSGAELAFCGHHAAQLPAGIREDLQPVDESGQQGYTLTLPAKQDTTDFDLEREFYSVTSTFSEELAYLSNLSNSDMLAFVGNGMREPSKQDF